MINNLLNRNRKNSIYDKDKKHIKFNTIEEGIKFQQNKSQSNKIKNNIIGKNEIKIHIPNKRNLLNNNRNLIFTNEEIKKYIKDNKGRNAHKEKDSFIRKIEYRSIEGINKKISDTLNIININRQLNKEPIFKEKKQLKEQSTNTYNKDSENHNYYRLDTPKLIPINSNKNKNQNIISSKEHFNYINNEEKKENQIYQINNGKSSVIEKNNYLNLNENEKIFNRNKKKEIINHVNNISINNNINFNQESNKNNVQYFLDLYNYNLMQSIIQNKSNFFDFKNKYFSSSKYKNRQNFSFLLNNTNFQSNPISLRELYRNLNNDNNSINSFNTNHIKKNKLKKKIKKNIIKKEKNDYNDSDKNIFDLSYKHKLMNVQYNLNVYHKSGNKKRINSFHNEKGSNLNSVGNKNEYFNNNYSKTNINFHKNISRQKYKNIKDDILEKGLSNSSPKIRTVLKNKFVFI